jgi:hypothetical protein
MIDNFLILTLIVKQRLDNTIANFRKDKPATRNNLKGITILKAS